MGTLKPETFTMCHKRTPSHMVYVPYVGHVQRFALTQWSPSPHLEGPRKAWKSITPTQGATQMGYITPAVWGNIFLSHVYSWQHSALDRFPFLHRIECITDGNLGTFSQLLVYHAQHDLV